MEEGRSSRTARSVAARRAAHQILDVPPVFEDPLAIKIADADAESDGIASRFLRAFIAVRSRFAEDELKSAVARGTLQYVVLGAGLDTFAYRNPYAGLRVFEVDHPATQAWKRHRLASAGIAVPDSLTFAPVDFERQSLRDGLSGIGFQMDRITWFAWLGVVPYLSLEAFRATINFIAAMPGGSGVTFDYSPPRSELNLRQRFALDRLSKRVASAGEPFRLFFKPSDLADELSRAGFHHLEDLGTAELNERYFANRSDGLRLWGGARLMSARV